MTIIIISLIAIVAVIVIGTKTKTNIGLWAITAAYIIGVFVLGESPRGLVGVFPTRLFLLLFSVTLFYSFAVLNGTLEKVADKVVYSVRNIPWAIPIVLYILSFIMAGIGAGDGATVMMIPIGLTIAKVTGMNNILAAVSCVSGISAGGFTPISTAGIFLRELIMNFGGHSEAEAHNFGNHALFQITLLYTIIFIIAYIVFKGYKIKAPELSKPEPFNKKQRINLAVIIGFVVLLVAAPLAGLLGHGNPVAVKFSRGVYLIWIAFIGVVLLSLFKVGDEKEAFKKVPLSALTTLCGMGTLIGIVSKTGAIEMVSNWLSTSVPTGIIPMMLALFAGIMSLFVSGFVVNTTFLALVPALAIAGGFNPGIAFAAVAVGSMATAVSPFSGSGGLVVASVDDDGHRKTIFNFLLGWPFINIALYLVMIAIGIY